MRRRLAAMLLAVMLPLFGFAASIAWQDYHDIVGQIRQRLDLASATTGDVVDAALGETERRLRAIASLSGVQDGPAVTCDALLGQLLHVEQSRYGALVIVDRQGTVRCSASTGSVGRDGYAKGQARLLASSVLPGSTGLLFGDPLSGLGSILPVGVQVAIEHFSGVALTTLSLEWLAQQIQRDRSAMQQVTGLVDAHGRIMPFGSATAAELASNDPAASLPQSGSVAAKSSQLQFRSTPLSGGLRLLVGLSTLPRLQEARQSLVTRLSALGVLLTAGLLAVTAGINGSVVQPVRKLSAAVARWREGGGFEPGSLQGAPREIGALSLSFGRAVAALNQREVQLREASTQQELLMQEIHHRVKNNLQIVASLLNLQASRIKLPEARAEFQAARDRIRALATLHRHLYAYGELHTINMRSFLIELCGQLLQALGETPAGGRIRLDIEAPELRISSDQAVPMALIVTEAVSNAAKYAFPGGRSGHIAVRLRIVDEGAASELLRLTIEDDGVGIPSGRAQVGEETRDGIGTRLIRGFARQLQAKMSLTHDSGTRYVLDIPSHRGRSDASAEA